MKESIDTFLYRELEKNTDLMLKLAVDPDVLPPRVAKLTDVEKRKIRDYRMAQQLAQRYVGGLDVSRP